MLPEILLDDIRFQELVSEARTRIVRHSPEWTEHNVSDPGITLIELFAWLTEILVYRINRIPERLQLRAARARRASRPAPPEQRQRRPVRFMLDRPGGGGVVPAGTEVASPRTAGSESVVFQTAEELVIPHECTLATYGVAAQGRTIQLAKDARRRRQLQAPFGSPAAAGDALLLGFDSPIAGLVIRLDDRVLARRGSRVEPERPAAGVGGVRWPTASGSRRPSSPMRPAASAAAAAPSRSRCPQAAAEATARAAVELSLAALPRAGPRLAATTARYTHVAGDQRRAGAGRRRDGRGVSRRDGDRRADRHQRGHPRGAPIALPHRPVLAPEDGETLEVRELGSDDWVPWQQVESFAAQRPRPIATSCSTSHAARSASGRRSGSPTAAGAATARSRPAGAVLRIQPATATAAAAPATSRRAR